MIWFPVSEVGGTKVRRNLGVGPVGTCSPSSRRPSWKWAEGRAKAGQALPMDSSEHKPFWSAPEESRARYEQSKGKEVVSRQLGEL